MHAGRVVRPGTVSRPGGRLWRMASTADLLVWIDCEMTGLDASIDELVEVAVVITDYDLVPRPRQDVPVS